MSAITVKGADKILRKLEKKGNPEQTQAALGKACALVERAAKQNAPKGNGDLRRSITSKVIPDGAGYAGIIFTPLEYAPYVEYGTGLFAEGGNGRQDVPWCYYDEELEEFESLDAIKKRLEKTAKANGKYLTFGEIDEAISHLDLSDSEVDNLVEYFKSKKIEVIIEE